MNLLSDPAYVLDLVSRHYDVPVVEIVGRSNQSRVAWARGVAMYVLRRHGNLTLLEIGGALDRDTSTVCQRVSQVERRIRAERAERELLQSALEDAGDPRVLMAGVGQALTEARAVLTRLEALQAEIEHRVGHRERVA